MNGLSVFDAHCDTIWRCLKTGEGLWSNSGMVSLEKTDHAFERYCQFFALWSDAKRTGHFTYDELLACFRLQMERNRRYIIQCRNGLEAERANREGKAAAFLAVEGAELLGCDLVRLEQAAADGVVAINLTWNHANAISGSSRDGSHRGLSDLGRRFVRKMEELGILVDVSHLSEAGFWDVAELARRPILASHSNARAIHDHPRNLTDGQITAIIKSQGVIGLNFYRDFIGRNEDFDAVRAHLDRILELGGACHVALGGDWDGCDTIDALPNVVDLESLYEYLLCHNYDEAILRDLFYNNLMRVVSQP